MANPSKIGNINLLFQPALANTGGNVMQKLSQICSICELNIEAGSYFEHLANAHSNPTKEKPSKQQEFSQKPISKDVSVKITKSAPKPKSKRRKKLKPSVNISGSSTDENILIPHKDKLHQKNVTLEETILRFKIKTCEIKLKRCDEIVANFNQNSKPAGNNNLEPKPVKDNVSRRGQKSKTRSTDPNIRKELYLCPFSGCGKEFSFKNNAKRHYRVHSGEKPYKCEVCNKRFASSSNLTVHTRTHTGDKPFECSVCSKRFSLFRNLTDHKRIHTGDMPFKCPYCSKRCRVSSNLTRHVRKVHKKVWNLSLGKKEQGQNLKVIEASPKNANKKQTGSQGNELAKSSKVAPSASKTILIKRRRDRSRKNKGNDLGEKQSKTFPSTCNQEESVKADQDDVVYACLQCPKKEKTTKSLEIHMKESHRLELAPNFNRNLLLYKPLK